MSELERKFQQEMMDTYEAAQKLGYRPSILMSLVSKKGAREAARELIRSPQPSDGFTKLWELKRLDISVEAKVLMPEYHDLFTDGERQLCRERLAEYAYEVPQ
ncbi:MAG: hypothetical protein LBI05_10895 [Planctomycetaceae bacterium]|nr:hypothetical protein [Planctomycetaceae bacterium]